MRSLTEVQPDALKAARDAAGTLMAFKAYLPPGGLLLMLVSKFRDDIGDVLGIEPGPLPQRGRERKSLDELTSVELSALSGAVAVLLEDRFTKVMDDPALPGLLEEYHDDLDMQKTERAQIRASIGCCE